MVVLLEVDVTLEVTVAADVLLAVSEASVENEADAVWLGDAGAL